MTVYVSVNCNLCGPGSSIVDENDLPKHVIAAGDDVLVRVESEKHGLKRGGGRWRVLGGRDLNLAK